MKLGDYRKYDTFGEEYFVKCPPPTFSPLEQQRIHKFRVCRDYAASTYKPYIWDFERGEKGQIVSIALVYWPQLFTLARYKVIYKAVFK